MIKLITIWLSNKFIKNTTFTFLFVIYYGLNLKKKL